MKRELIGLLFFVSIIFSCKSEEKKQTLVLGDFVMSQETITHNQPITITYNGEDENMDAFYYQLNADKAYPIDLNFKNKVATLVVPDSITAIALNFKIDGDYLNNEKKGYLFAVNNENGEPIAGSQSSLEYYKVSYGETYGIDYNSKTFVAILQKEINKYSKVKEAWKDTYLNILLTNDREKGEIATNAAISEISNKETFTEEDYNTLYAIYTMTRKSNLADSISRIAIKKYPKGKIKQQVLMNQFYDVTTLEEKETLFKEMYSNSNMTPELSYVASSIASQYFDYGNITAFKNYVDKINDPSQKAGLYNSVAWPLAEKGENLDIAVQLSKSSLDLMEALQNNLNNKPLYFSEKQYKKSLKNTYNMYADTYAVIQYKLGNTKEAIKYQVEAIGDGMNVNINERYIEFLLADKQYQLASNEAYEFLNKDKGSEKITTLYKTAYTKANPEANDFDTKIAAIKEKAKDKTLAELKKIMLDEDAPEFTLKNLDGENITLSSLKGQTVILDFWATWCGPCKASFPGMQHVVEKYKNNQNVTLLFIDTFEDGKNREEDVAKFIEDNNYDFHVLIDNKIDKSDTFQVADKYGITGIPTKIVIGPKGRVKFKSVGFSGSNDKLKQEMDMMIDLLKS